MQIYFQPEYDTFSTATLAVLADVSDQNVTRCHKRVFEGSCLWTSVELKAYF